MNEEGDTAIAWHTLPLGLLFPIVHLLPSPSILSLTMVCKNWYLLSSVDWIWKELVKYRWPVLSSVSEKEGKERFVELAYHKMPVIFHHTTTKTQIGFSGKKNPEISTFSTFVSHSTENSSREIPSLDNMQ